MKNQESREIKIREFTDLVAWQKAHELAIDIYSATKKFPKEELYGLTSQMRRAAVSISSNIAEGFGRIGYKEKMQFYYISHGSLTELKNQLLIARDIGCLADEEFNHLDTVLIHVHRLLRGLLKKTSEILDCEPSGEKRAERHSKFLIPNSKSDV